MESQVVTEEGLSRQQGTAQRKKVGLKLTTVVYWQKDTGSESF
jgi:hypothetical protein